MCLQAKDIGVELSGRWVFRGVSLHLDRGQHVSLIGPSGSGKSLLLRSLVMLQRLAEGTVLWNQQPVSGNEIPDFRTQVMYLSQHVAEMDGTVEDFLRIPFRFAANRNRSLDLPLTKDYLDRLGRKNDFLQLQQRSLSGGERQIAALIRVLLLQPKVILLDEPTSALDPETAKAAEQLLDSWREEDASRSTVWVTHNMEQASRVSSVQWRMSDGQMTSARCDELS